MLRSKKFKSILLTACLTIGFSTIAAANVYAYTPGTASYTVAGGDSLFKISQVFHTSVDVLVSTNGLKNTSLNIGQVLKVPGDTYTVQKGDTLYLIAGKYKIALSELQRANNIYNDKLDLGQRLSVPVSGSGTTATGGSSSAPTVTPSDSAAYSASDLDLLSRLIMAEAQGEPYNAKVAVGAVVLNRVESGLFAGSIHDVIYQNINGYYQFTPVANGWIDKPANTDSVNAAKDVLNGVDPTKGALWYYDIGTTNTFMLSKAVSVQIGNMVFAF
jgi:Cell wall hydrolyses involved in spore germination